MVAKRAPDVAFVVVGRGMVDFADHSRAATEAKSLLGERLIVLPESNSVSDIMPAFDVFVLSSAYGEGFPNVVGEALACGVPVVATDVGDCQTIIGDCGITVRPRAPIELADGISKMLALNSVERAEIANRARSRVVQLYSIDAISRQYEAEWQKYRDVLICEA